MRPILASATEIIRPLVGFKTVQNVQMLCRCGPLDAWFTYFPLLGNEIQYILVSPFLAWCCGADGQTAMRHFTLMSFGACWISNSLKELFKLPRPPAALQVGNSDVERVSLQYGFPSTHSAHAISLVWFCTRFAHAQGAISATNAAYLAVLQIFHICFSRLYLGVHSLADITAGLCVGTATIFLFMHVLQPLDEVGVAFASRSPLAGCAALILCGSTVPCLLLYPDKRPENTAWVEVVLFGAVYVGAAIACAMAPHSELCPAQSTGTKAGLYFLGLVFLGTTRVSLSALSKVAFGGSSRLKRLDPSGREVDTTLNVLRSLVVTMLTASAVAGVRPPCFWLPAAMQ